MVIPWNNGINGNTHKSLYILKLRWICLTTLLNTNLLRFSVWLLYTKCLHERQTEKFTMAQLKERWHTISIKRQENQYFDNICFLECAVHFIYLRANYLMYKFEMSMANAKWNNTTPVTLSWCVVHIFCELLMF